MPGPDPKPGRSRRNVPVKVASQVFLPESGRAGPAPKPRTDRELSDRALEMWRDWWRSPQATQWDQRTHIYPLTRLLELYDGWFRHGEVSDKTLTEMRQIEARFGLDPKGMKDLGWVIRDLSAADGEEAPKSKPGRRRPSGGGDPRANLKVV